MPAHMINIRPMPFDYQVLPPFEVMWVVKPEDDHFLPFFPPPTPLSSLPIGVRALMELELMLREEPKKVHWWNDATVWQTGDFKPTYNMLPPGPGLRRRTATRRAGTAKARKGKENTGAV